MRYVIQTALVFNSSDAEYLLIEFAEGGDLSGYGRIVGQFHDIGGAMKYAHARMEVRPQLTVIENRKKINDGPG